MCVCVLCGVFAIFGVRHCYDGLCRLILCVDSSNRIVDVGHVSMVLLGHSVQFGLGYERNLIHMPMKSILKPKKLQGLWEEKYIKMVQKD